MFISKKASRLRDIACLAFVIGMMMTGCGGGSSDNENSSGSGDNTSASSSSATTSLSVLAKFTGWASKGNGSTGGVGALASNIYVVHNRAELNAALANTNSATYASNSKACGS